MTPEEQIKRFRVVETNARGSDDDAPTYYQLCNVLRECVDLCEQLVRERDEAATLLAQEHSRNGKLEIERDAYKDAAECRMRERDDEAMNAAIILEVSAEWEMEAKNNERVIREIRAECDALKAKLAVAVEALQLIGGTTLDKYGYPRGCEDHSATARTTLAKIGEAK